MLKNINKVIKHKPDGATHVVTSMNVTYYAKKNRKGELLYHNGVGFYAFKENSKLLLKCDSVRLISELEAIAEMAESLVK